MNVTRAVRTALLLGLLGLLALPGCGGGRSIAATAPKASTTAATPPAPTAPPPTPAPVAVPDFQVVAYQGDDTFGGHNGHFAAAFAAGRPVVLLYFAGL